MGQETNVMRPFLFYGISMSNYEINNRKKWKRDTTNVVCYADLNKIFPKQM